MSDGKKPPSCCGEPMMKAPHGPEYIDARFCKQCGSVNATPAKPAEFIIFKFKQEKTSE